ncbi:hypothetical protein SCLCIDRAFT_34119 [Scleroderma citrinum Foug A]|uniref:Uncharacterized protein n=1 Tax=Scleroderma citrinum Foug A TaxID=1036808 RepID=A0A0C2ZCA1_9AGAM|nr:hypothetical protein SCLCIDRAFT_34119 [Scleroderma citrinum Foug A]
MQHATHWLSRGGCLAIYTDIFNCVDVQHSLRFPVPGKDDIVADHLSRGRIADALALSPALAVSSFQPPSAGSTGGAEFSPSYSFCLAPCTPLWSLLVPWQLIDVRPSWAIGPWSPRGSTMGPCLVVDTPPS